VGALVKAKEILSIDEICNSLQIKFSKKFNQKVIDGNLRALKRAYEEMQAV